MIDMSDNNSTGSTDDYHGNTETATCCPHIETVDEEQIEIEYIRRMRELIKEQSRITFYIKPVLFNTHTNNIPRRNYKMHNHPRRFLKEGL